MRTVLKFGLFTALAICTWNFSSFTIINWLDKMFSLGIPAARVRGFSGLFGIILLLIGIYLGMKTLKNKNNNQITYSKAIKAGIIISLICAVMAAIFAFTYCTLINPGYTDFMVNESKNALVIAKKTPQEIALRLEDVRKQFSTSSQVFQALIGQSVIGSIGSLIISLFVRTKSQNN